MKLTNGYIEGVGQLVLLGATIRVPWAVASAPTGGASTDPNDITVKLSADGALSGGLDPGMYEPVHIHELLDLVDLPAGATPEQIRDQLKLLIAKGCTHCLSAYKHLALLGAVVAMAANGVAWDLGGDGFLHWRDMAGIAGHPEPDKLSPAKAWKFVQDQLASAGAGLISFQDLGGLLGMVTTSTKAEIVQRFRELAQAVKQPVQTLSATTPGERRSRLILLGVQAISSPKTDTSGVTGLARAIAAHEAETRPAPVTLSSEAPDMAGLTGLKRAIAANKHEHGLRKADEKLKPKIVKLSSAHDHLTGIDRAIVSHALNRDS